MVLVSIIYEKLHVLCYQCGVVGHGAENCIEAPPTKKTMATRTELVQGSPAGVPIIPLEAGPAEKPIGEMQKKDSDETPHIPEVKQDRGYRPWMTDQRKQGSCRGRGRGRGTGRGGGHGGGRDGERGALADEKPEKSWRGKKIEEEEPSDRKGQDVERVPDSEMEGVERNQKEDSLNLRKTVASTSYDNQQ
ncbi:hypothetical protein J5N97_010498 [Dioscorea zingiberensis]|uniref:CCHC-type domain-containing protein n=1 Tax=Dioscorea zingiberensis TaxID=325984 RepID=A0A9D5CZH8_9LILI|nr:hypothetical protein J5N97_010498 [Dioscorea zingiberensis]